MVQGKVQPSRLVSWSSSTLASCTPQPVAQTSLGAPSWAHMLYVLDVYRYVLLCLVFGTSSLIVGGTIFSLSFVIRVKTSSTQLVESVPLYLPGLILIFNGLVVIAFMSKRARRFYLLKCIASLYLLVAFMFIVVGVTTAVIHLPRLNNYRECVFTTRLRACTCVHHPSFGITSSIANKHFVMEDVDSCEVVHTLIYDSLRVIFALSLVSIVICVLSIITLYQMIIRERRKLYFARVDSFRSKYCEVTATRPVSESVYMRPRLEADFSSQDLLVSKTSSALAGEIANQENGLPYNHQIDRIWSSSQCSRHSTPARLSKAPSEPSFRHYVNVIKDKSSRFQAMFKPKLKTATNGQSSQSVCDYHSHDHFALHNICLREYPNMPKGMIAHNSSHPDILPPHVLRSLYAQSVHYEQTHAIDHQPPVVELTHSHDHNSLCSPSSSSSSDEEATLTSISAHQAASEHSNFLAINDNSQYFTNETDLMRTSFKQEGETQDESNMGETITPVSVSHWPHGGVFGCVDEDETSIEMNRIPVEVVVPETTIITGPYYTQYYGRQEKSDHKVNDDQHYKQAFEEAFNNYYNSQNRITQQQYYDPQETSKPSEDIEDHPYLTDNNNVDASKQQQLVMTEDEFPAIEPPADYKNNIVIYVDSDTPAAQASIGSKHSMETLTNHNLVQSYNFWVQQFIDQISQQALEMNDHDHESNDQFDSMDNGLVEDDDDDDDDDLDNDDGAGDTSTSQDIADFELELDEEPIKYDEDTFNEKNNSIIQPLPVDPPVLEQTAPPDNNNIDQTATLKTVRRKPPNKEYCLDAKSCESSHSLTNKAAAAAASEDEASESLTAEFIKPPTPFTSTPYYRHAHLNHLPS